MLDANLISNTDQIIDFDANEEILVSDNNQYKRMKLNLLKHKFVEIIRFDHKTRWNVN